MSSVEPADVFAEWEQDAGGVWTRRAARVIAVDAADRVLLLRGFDVDTPSRTWWFTPGGGLAPGETERAAAARELFEETGLRVGPGDLVGPVAERRAYFPYFGRRCRQDEELFFAQIGAVSEVSTAGWTAVERASVSELRWWSLTDLVGTGDTVYPPALRELLQTLLADGWDGTTRTID